MSVLVRTLLEAETISAREYMRAMREEELRAAMRAAAQASRFGLAVGAACAFSLGIAGQVLKFRTKARMRVTPPVHTERHMDSK